MGSYRRHSGFTVELGDIICEELLQGQSVLAISKIEGMPSDKTIRRWGYKAEYSSEAFVVDYARAREEGAHTEFDKLRDLECRLLGVEGYEPLDPQAGRVAIDSIKWRLSKMLPKTYGDASVIKHEGGIQVRPIVDMCPEWLQERISKAAAEEAIVGGTLQVIENGQDEDESGDEEL